MNADGAAQALDAARAALAAGDVAKAERLVDKAMKLHPSDDVRRVRLEVKAKRGAPPPPPPGPRPASPNGGVRHRAPATGGAASEPSTSAQQREATPEQRRLITTVLEARCYYAVLSLPRSASDDDIKRAYRRLALRLHPDKCGAPRAPDAFRAASRAFACLSDPHKRRTYDRTGVDPDDPNAGRGGGGGFGFGGPGATRRRGGGHSAGGFYSSNAPFPDGFDPEEIFNAFFGMGGGFGGGAGPFGGPFGPPPAARRRPPARGAAADGEPAAPPWAALLAQLAPLLLLLLLAILPGGSDEPYGSHSGGPGLASPPVSLDARPPLYGVRLETGPPARTPFYVSSAEAFNARFPPRSRARARIEDAADEAARERLVRACADARRKAGGGGGGGLFGWGRGSGADAAFDAPACEELAERFGR